VTDPTESNPFKLPEAPPRRLHRPLPTWLARRLLREGEEVTWVRGPHWNPGLERYITHPALFLVALLLVGVCLAAGWLFMSANRGPYPEAAILAAGGIFFGAVLILAYANAYFTRLVVTNFRLLILQGYEVCKVWRIDDLPMSLRRYRRRPGGRGESWSVDLDALQNMLGGATDQFVDAKKVLALGKQLDNIKAREQDRP
jgi:hypothetical protein